MRDTLREAAITWVQSQLCGHSAPLLFVMVVRAVFLSTVRRIVALVHLVVVRMILLLFPAVAVDAAILEVAAIAVGLRFLLRAPELTLLLR